MFWLFNEFEKVTTVFNPDLIQIQQQEQRSWSVWHRINFIVWLWWDHQTGDWPLQWSDILASHCSLSITLRGTNPVVLIRTKLPLNAPRVSSEPNYRIWRCFPLPLLLPFVCLSDTTRWKALALSLRKWRWQLPPPPTSPSLHSAVGAMGYLHALPLPLPFKRMGMGGERSFLASNIVHFLPTVG